MKENKKIMRIIAGSLFLLAAAICATKAIPLITKQEEMNALQQMSFIINAIGVLILSVMGILALMQKQMGKAVQILGFLGVLVVVLYYASIKKEYALPIMLFVALLLVRMGDGFTGGPKDTSSEAAKIQIQAEKQTTIYDEQLRDGILTQEEYDQIMKNRK